MDQQDFHSEQHQQAPEERRRIPREQIPGTPVTWVLCGICLAVFLYANVLRGDEVYQLQLAFDPAHGKTLPGLFIHMFVHANWFHLLSNMLGLVIIGRWVEMRYGPLNYLVLFYVCSLVAGMAQAVHAPGYALVGASGGVFALLAAFVRHFPNVRFYIIFPPIPWPLPAWFLVGIMALYNVALWVGELYNISWMQTNLAYMAHLAGLVAGFAMSFIMIPADQEGSQDRQSARDVPDFPGDV